MFLGSVLPILNSLPLLSYLTAAECILIKFLSDWVLKFMNLFLIFLLTLLKETEITW